MTASSQIGQMTADLEVFFCVNADCLLDLLAKCGNRAFDAREREGEREGEKGHF